MSSPIANILDNEGQAAEVLRYVLNSFGQVAPVSKLNSAIPLCRQAVRQRGSSDVKRLTSMYLLANALLLHNLHTRQARSLDEAISVVQEGLRLQAPSHPIHSQLLGILSGALVIRYISEGRANDIAEAVRTSARCSAMQAEARQSFERGQTIVRQFQTSRQAEDLDAACLLFYRSIRTLFSVDAPQYHEVLGRLAEWRCDFFEEAGREFDLEECIALHEERLMFLPATHRVRLKLLADLASALSTRFEKKGQRGDLERAVKLCREALVLVPAPNPIRPMVLSNLVNALWGRFEQEGQLDDLREAISLLKEALVLCAPSHSAYPMLLDNLADAVSVRFEKNRELDDLEEPILLRRETLTLHPAPDPGRWDFLNRLAKLLMTRVEQYRRLVELEKAISLVREAVMLCPASHSDHPKLLDNLANLLSERYEHGG